MHVVFRADASPSIGGGHVQRCLTLADAFAAEGWDCSFAFREGTPDTVPALKASRHALLPLSGPEQDEPSEMTRLLQSGCDLLGVDHYRRGAAYETHCRGFASRILALDDKPDRPHDADILLDATPRADDSVYRAVTPAACQLLLGPRYSLLRPQFTEARAASLARRSRESAPRRLLVSMGMTDPGNVTARVLWGVAASGLPLAVDIVLGATAPHIADVRSLIAELGLDATLHVNVSDMAALASAADVAIGASGQTSFERCCLGLPSLMAVTADNQTDFADALAGAGAVARLPSLDEADIAAALTKIVGDADYRQTMSRRAAALCDGQGAPRAAKMISAAVTAPSEKAVSV